MLVGFPLGFALALVLVRIAPSKFPLRRHPASIMFLGVALLLGLIPLGSYYLLLQCRKTRLPRNTAILGDPYLVFVRSIFC